MQAPKLGDAVKMDNVLYCDCGREATRLCSDVTGIEGLMRCTKPLCDSAGHGWCAEHRHQRGTMGYMVSLKGEADFEGLVPDGAGLWYALLNLWRKLTYSAPRIANYVWSREVIHFPPPAPLPTFTLHINGRSFVSQGKKMVETTKYPEALR